MTTIVMSFVSHLGTFAETARQLGVTTSAVYQVDSKRYYLCLTVSSTQWQRRSYVYLNLLKLIHNVPHISG